MKKLLLILLCLPMLTLAQQTYVPDNNFEAYLEANNMGNGTANDDYVTTANINTITVLYAQGLSISDLTGIEDFISLYHLNCMNNNLINLDLSQNTALAQLGCSYNQLTGLDLSKNTALDSLDCSENQLTKLDVRNGYNSGIWYFNSMSNPDLTCINVDNINYSTNNWIYIDTQHYFSANCSGTTNIKEHTTKKELLKVTDLLGRETNQTFFYIYNDGTVEKRIVVE